MDDVLRWVDSLHKHSEALLSWQVPLIAVPIYLFVIFGLDRIIKKPKDMKYVMAAHNGFLCLWSLAMLLGAGYEGFYKLYPKVGMYEIYCNGDGQTMVDAVVGGRLWFWCFLFYVSKYYEMLDTVIMVFRKKPLTLLHVYHHCIIVPLVLAFMRGGQLFFFTGVMFNAAIHTFMYYYYAISSLGGTVWWKKHLTKAQIFQFMFGVCSWWPYPFYCTGYILDHMGHMKVWLFNQLVLFSFLVLFVRFFTTRYGPEDAKSARQPAKKTARKVE